jgi:hypothetical protein
MKESHGIMAIPEDPLQRRKWMLRLWREDYGAQFSVFDPEDQPAPELESWQSEMWEPYDPKPDTQGNYNPAVLRHLRWFEETKRFFADQYQVNIVPDLFFDCKAMQYQGRFSDKIAPENERFWYIRALRIGVFLFDGKLGIGFSCRSLSCQRRKCPLNLKNENRLNRVDIYQLLQVFEGEKAMPISRAVAEVSKWFDLTLHGFGQAYCAVPKESVYRQLKLYNKNIPKLIKNFSNLCGRSDLVYFDLKPPTDKVFRDHFFFPETMITAGTLDTINSPAVVTYIYLWMLRMEQLQRNRFKFELPTYTEMEKDTESRGFKISRRSIERHIVQLEAAKTSFNFSGPIS